MAYQGNLKTISRPAAADLAASQYRFIKSNGAGKVTPATVAGEAVLGVLQNDPIADEAATIAIDGSITKIVAGGVVGVDAQITTDNQGRAVAAATGNLIHGIAQNAAGGAGEIISVLLKPGAAAKA